MLDEYLYAHKYKDDAAHKLGAGLIFCSEDITKVNSEGGEGKGHGQGYLGRRRGTGQKLSEHPENKEEGKRGENEQPSCAANTPYACHGTAASTERHTPSSTARPCRYSRQPGMTGVAMGVVCHFL